MSITHFKLKTKSLKILQISMRSVCLGSQEEFLYHLKWNNNKKLKCRYESIIKDVCILTLQGNMCTYGKRKNSE